MTGGTQGERLAAVEAWQEGHEKRCEDRQASMGREIGEVKTAIKELSSEAKGQRKAAWALAVAIVGWAMLQLYDGLKSPSAQMINVTAPPPAVAK